MVVPKLNIRTARTLVALWEFLRPFAVVLSGLLAVFVEVIIACGLWDNLNLALVVMVCVFAFPPIMIGIYVVLSFPVNALISIASMSIEEE